MENDSTDVRYMKNFYLEFASQESVKWSESNLSINDKKISKSNESKASKSESNETSTKKHKQKVSKSKDDKVTWVIILWR